MISASEWNSLEIVKLAVSFLTPLLLIGLGIIVSRAARRVEDAQWASRKLIDRRLETFDQMAPQLNDLYCFFRFFGNFREIDPPSAVELKRDLDKTFHINKHLFSKRFADCYEAFMETCYETYTGVGQDAELRSSAERQRRERGGSWDPTWDNRFAAHSVSELGTVRETYEELMDCFADELGVRRQPG